MKNKVKNNPCSSAQKLTYTHPNFGALNYYCIILQHSCLGRNDSTTHNVNYKQELGVQVDFFFINLFLNQMQTVFGITDLLEHPIMSTLHWSEGNLK